LNAPAASGTGRDKTRNGPRTAARLWSRAFLTGFVAFAFGVLYFFVRQFVKDGVWSFDLTLVNKSLGTTSLFLITLSMFLTGLARFSRRPPRPLVFRKHHGLVGFWVGLAHGGVTHFLMPAVGLRAERKVEALDSHIPGLAALILFGIMAVLSIPAVKGFVGGRAWRRLLRYGGYAGLILAAGHTALLKWESWTNFFRTFDPALPSLSLPAALFAAAAVVFRLAAWIAGRRPA
jgi:hypothetical protein